jgi:hypothetical protein
MHFLLRTGCTISAKPNPPVPQGGGWILEARRFMASGSFTPAPIGGADP